MMPEPSIPGVGIPPVVLAVGGLLLATIVFVAGIFVVTSRKHPTTASTSAAVASVAAPQPVDVPSAVAPEAIVPLASVAPIAIPAIPPPPVSAKVAAAPAIVPAAPAIVPASSHAGSALAGRASPTSPKASAGPTTTPTSTAAAPPQKGQFGGAGVDDQY
jgi:hypothetical protein